MSQQSSKVIAGIPESMWIFSRPSVRASVHSTPIFLTKAVHCRGLFHHIYSPGAVSLLPQIIAQCRKKKDIILNGKTDAVRGKAPSFCAGDPSLTAPALFIVVVSTALKQAGRTGGWQLLHCDVTAGGACLPQPA